ncbi:MarR family winged helix-turn-helix transcriptional regulator [Methanobrevibacter sp. DSM 116169]|uniref:MarR family winged helix-turn-helix transcriptional regulator n=1 Tax=Methanobrevibacter sp. DSM 116169 TaxID=3242727 RepID=UPI0038FD3CC0
MYLNQKFKEEDFNNLSMPELISVMNNSYRHYLIHNVSQLNITPGQISFLLQLENGKNTSQDELAKNLFLSHGTVAKALRKLDDNGLIQRKVAENNRRKYEVCLTKKGQDIASKVKNIDQEWEAMVYEHLNLDLSDDEKENFMNVLRILAKGSFDVIKDEKINFKEHGHMPHPFRGSFGKHPFGSPHCKSKPYKK